MSTFVYCSVCGKKFLKPPQPLYKLTKGGRTVYQCTYPCWNKGKEMPAEEHLWLARQRKGDTHSALYIRNNQHDILKDGDAFICEFEGYRHLCLKQFTSCLFYTLENNGEQEFIRIRDLHFLHNGIKIVYISNILNHKSKGAIENLLEEYGCSKIN